MITLDAAATGMGSVGEAFSYVLTSFGTVMSTITDSPVLCLGIGFWIAGAAIGLFQRLV